MPTTLEVLGESHDAASQSARPPPFALSDISANCGGNKKMLDMLLSSYRSEHVAELVTLFESNEIVRLAKLAHKIKGSLRYLCAHQAAELAFQIESDGKTLTAGEPASDDGSGEVPEAAEIRHRLGVAVADLQEESDRVQCHLMACLKLHRAQPNADDRRRAEGHIRAEAAGLRRQSHQELHHQ